MHVLAGSLNVMVLSDLQDRGRHWPSAKYEDLVTMQSKLPLIELVDENRSYWIPSKSSLYSCFSTWSYIRRKNLEVKWWKLIWFQGAIPKYAFIGWLAI